MLKKDRDSNIELLRIVLMFMVVVLHLVAHGCDFLKVNTGSYERTSKDFLFSLLTSFTVIAVNCFVFISGYYGIKFRVKSLMSFLLQGLFYSVTAYLILGVWVFGLDIWSVSFLKSFFPVSNTEWWFFNSYLGLYILAPIINKGTDSLTIYRLGGLAVILVYTEATHLITGANFFSGNGFNLYTIMVVYIIARFCRRLTISLPKPFLIYLALSFLVCLWIYCLLSINKQSLAWRITVYNCPLIILAAISFFYGFKQMRLKSRLINKIAPLVFGVYLIHESSFVSRILYSIMRELNSRVDSSLTIMAVLFLAAILVFITGICIEGVRQKICNPLLDYVYNKIILRLLMKGKQIATDHNLPVFWIERYLDMSPDTKQTR